MTITPGPWFTLTGFEGGVIVSTEVGPQWAAHVVAEVKRPEDGRLIKAAPALLEAAELAVNSISMDIYRMAAAGQPYGNLDQAEQAIEQLRAAIAMAKEA